MHVHVSLWKGESPRIYDGDNPHAELGQLARYFAGGLITHARAMAAITNPTTNSYRRLVQGYEAPVYKAWSRRNISANIRVSCYKKDQKTAARKRLEYRTPDSSSNPYLCFAAMTSAGLDGIKKKLDPGDPVDENIYHLTLEKRHELGIQDKSYSAH